MTWIVAGGDGKQSPWKWRMDWTATRADWSLGTTRHDRRHRHPRPHHECEGQRDRRRGQGADRHLSQRATPVSGSNGFGPYERDRSNGGSQLGDGQPIKLNGVTYARGLGMHSPANIKYALRSTDRTFMVAVGIDDECNGGSVTFDVYVDGTKRATSGVLTGQSPTRTLTVDVTSKSTLQLVVGDAGDGKRV